MTIDSITMSQYSQSVYGQQRMAPPPPPNLKELIESKDQDGDGLLSNEEFDISEDKFLEIDTDSDGLLSEEELQTDMDNHRAEMMQNGMNGLMQGTDPSQFVDMIMSTRDQDGDGSLTLEEFGQSEDKFTNIDTDGDGLLSTDELEADMQANMPPPPPPQQGMGGQTGGIDDSTKTLLDMLNDDEDEDDSFFSIYDIYSSQEDTTDNLLSLLDLTA